MLQIWNICFWVQLLTNSNNRKTCPIEEENEPVRSVKQKQQKSELKSEKERIVKQKRIVGNQKKRGHANKNHTMNRSHCMIWDAVFVDIGNAEQKHIILSNRK